MEAIIEPSLRPRAPGAGPTRRDLLGYRVMAFSTATLLIVLVFAGLPLQLAAHRPVVVNVVGTVHGFLYLVYLLAAFRLARRLAVPRWQMALVLAAGTVPFCAFVAERKLTRRFRALSGAADGAASEEVGPDGQLARRAARRRRWWSRRALVLHLEVLVVAPACALAGWWQATRALSGNTLSWVYSIEWPIFSLLSLLAWWHLVHEDPAAYEARRLGGRRRRERAQEDGGEAVPTLPRVAGDTTKAAYLLVVLVGVEVVLGVLAVLSVPFGRPDGWRPHQGVLVYDAHSLVALPLGLGALALLVRTRGAERLARLTAVIGAAGVALAALGGLMTGSHALRFAGMAVMFLGAVTAGFAYLIPALERSEG